MSKQQKRVPVAPPPAESKPATAPLPWWKSVLHEPLALGLVPLILIRPWLDGVTYPTDNFYFVWGTMILFALWAVRLLMRGEPIRFGIPIMLLAGFWCVAVLTAFGTVQFDATYRHLILWAGNLALFIVVTNGVRSTAALAIVLGAFVVSSLAESVWSLIHYRYILPYVRETIMSNPALLKTYFGTSELLPELAHRLEVNRAFGSLLFPNALSALLILGIPYAVTGTVQFVRLLKRDRAEGLRSAGSPLATVVAASLAWFAGICIATFLFPFIASFEMPLPPGVERVAYIPLIVTSEGAYHMDSAVYTLLWLLFVVVAPVALALSLAWVVRRHGLRTMACVLCVTTLPILSVMEVWALWRTYSRGGWLALAMAVTFTACLLLAKRMRSPSARASAAAAMIVALVAATTSQAAPGEAQTPPVARPAPKIQAAPPGNHAPSFALKPPVQPPPAKQPAAQTASQPAQPPPQAPAQPSIRKEGVNLTLRDLLNPASFWLRLTYWQTGFNMAKANFWTGVGLGNFGTVYPKYQSPEAGDVKAAHNDYLEALCETGIFGFLFFTSFWGYFVVWGARRIYRESDTTERLLLAGVYTGVLAFLIQSLVEFNFFNPATSFYAFLLGGLFYARAKAADLSGTKNVRHQVLGVPMLLWAAIIVGMAARLYLADFIIGGHNVINVGNNRKINAVFDAGLFFLKGVGTAQSAGKYPVKDIVTVAYLFPDRDMIEKFGVLYAPNPSDPSKHRAIARNEMVPTNAFVAITKQDVAREAAVKQSESFLEQLEVADGIFPHSPERAAYFTQWYDLLSSTASDPAKRQHYTVEFVKWAEEAVRRSPEQALFHEWCAKAYWMRGNIEPTAERKKFFERGLEEYRIATTLYPTSGYLWVKYGDALDKYGQALKAAGDAQGGQAMIDKGAAMTQRGQKLSGTPSPEANQ